MAVRDRVEVRELNIVAVQVRDLGGGVALGRRHGDPRGRIPHRRRVVGDIGGEGRAQRALAQRESAQGRVGIGLRRPRHRHPVGLRGGAVLRRQLHLDDVFAHLQVDLVAVRARVEVRELIAVAVQVVDVGGGVAPGRRHRDPRRRVRRRCRVVGHIGGEGRAQHAVAQRESAQGRVAGGGRRQRQRDRDSGGPGEVAVIPNKPVTGLIICARQVEGVAANMQAQPVQVGGGDGFVQSKFKFVIKIIPNITDDVAVPAVVDGRVGQRAGRFSIGIPEVVSVFAQPHRHGRGPDLEPARKVRGHADEFRPRHRDLVGLRGAVVPRRHLHLDDVVAHLQVHLEADRARVGVREIIAVAVQVVDPGGKVALDRRHRGPRRCVRHRCRVVGHIGGECRAQAASAQREIAQCRVAGFGGAAAQAAHDRHSRLVSNCRCRPVTGVGESLTDSVGDAPTARVARVLSVGDCCAKRK